MNREPINQNQLRTKEQWRLYCELELIDWNESGLDFGKAKLQTALASVWQHVKELFEPIDEPQIQELVDRHGKTYWQIYDPVNDRIFRLNSPQEVATWLENLALRRLHLSNF